MIAGYGCRGEGRIVSLTLNETFWGRFPGRSGHHISVIITIY